MTTPTTDTDAGRYVLVHGGWMLEPTLTKHRDAVADLIKDAPLVVVHDVMELTKLSANTVVKALLALDYVQLNEAATLVDSTWEYNPEVRKLVRFRPRRNGTYLKTRELLRQQQDVNPAVSTLGNEPDDEPEDEPMDLVPVTEEDSWPLDMTHLDPAATSLQQITDMAQMMGLTIEIRVRRTPVATA